MKENSETFSCRKDFLKHLDSKAGFDTTQISERHFVKTFSLEPEKWSKNIILKWHQVMHSAKYCLSESFSGSSWKFSLSTDFRKIFPESQDFKLCRTWCHFCNLYEQFSGLWILGLWILGLSKVSIFIHACKHVYIEKLKEVGKIHT